MTQTAYPDDGASTSLLLLSMILAAIALTGTRAVADQRACTRADVQPAYPPLNAPPIVHAVSSDATTVSGSACFGERKSAATWVTVAAVLQTSVSQDQLIKRFGAISELRGVQYWSTTEQSWRPMISAAFAVDSADAVQARADYPIAELLAGAVRYYRVADTRSDLAVTYTLRLQSNQMGHLVVETTNLDPVKKWGITFYRRSDLRTLYFLDERFPGIWSYYSITRVVSATFLARGHAKSYINRAVALFRHYMGLPTAGDAPAAR